MRQGKARAAVSDAFVSMGSVFLSVCGKDVLASCSEDPIKKKKKKKVSLFCQICLGCRALVVILV